MKSIISLTGTLSGLYVFVFSSFTSRLLAFLLVCNDLLTYDLYLSYRIAESKKEVANRFYAKKQYKKALAGYNEVIGKYCALLYRITL